MFDSKKCKYCNKDLKKDWNYCPHCGKNVKEKKIGYRRPFDMFTDIEEEFEEIDKILGPEFVKFPKIDMRPMFRGGGISITIRNVNGRPKIDVRTSGNYKKVEPRLKKKLGVPQGGETEKPRKERKMPKKTEEPEMKVERKGSAETITIKLPDVKSKDDVEIRKLEQSIEVKGFAGDKAYFKLIPIRSNARIADRSFNNGVLRIEIE